MPSEGRVKQRHQASVIVGVVSLLLVAIVVTTVVYKHQKDRPLPKGLSATFGILAIPSLLLAIPAGYFLVTYL